MERKITLQIEISYMNVNFPDERGTSTQFSESLVCLLFLKIILIPKRKIFDWHILPSFRSLSDPFLILFNQPVN